ncbi:MAG: M48 family metallopeptidase [Kiritimatiellae bacterium]|nr:M48 family metallopeptidase [Kiritimatiellia bacterium]MDD5523339.1 M48 family metallopeptidase [Kiritimatiellia bacterium]
MNSYLIIILLILAGRYLVELIADWLNVKAIQTDIPAEFNGYFDAEKYRKSQNYLRDNTSFGIITDSFDTIVTIIFIIIGGFNFVDHIARHFNLGPIATGLVFAGILILATKLLNLPFSFYDTFVLEEKYGFNKTTLKIFILDIIKSLVLITILGGVIFSAVLWLFEKTGTLAWLYCWITISLFQVLMIFIAPYVIMPLFNKFIPLEDGELKSAIENYAKSQNFKIKGVFKMDGSKRSAKSNAFFTGFGKSRRIVLFDTLIAKHTVPELVAVVAHEMGHYKKRHITKAIIRSIALTGFTLFLLSIFIGNKKLFDAFKMEHTSIYASLFFFGFLYSPIAMLVSLVENVISRKHEYEADTYAVHTCGNAEAMINALKKLSVDNLSNLTPHPFKVILNYGHPPILERIKAIRMLSEKNSEK